MPTNVINLGNDREVRDHEVRPALHLVYDTVTGGWKTANSTEGKQHVITYVWDTNLLSFVPAEKAAAGTGGDVNVTNWPATQAVTGTFWQATQPVSIAAPVALDAATLAALETVTAAVSGTVALDATTLAALELIQATISGTVAVSNFTDNGLTDAQLRASAVPVAITPAVNTASGNITGAAQSVAMNLNGSSSVGIHVSGVWAGTLQLQASHDGTNWANQEFYNPISTDELAHSSTTVNGYFQLINIAGIVAVRVLCSAYGSGIAAVDISGTQATTSINPAIKENGDPIPSYGQMVAGSDGTLLRYLKTLVDGSLVVDAKRAQSPLFAVISSSSSGDNQLVAAAGVGLKIKVLQYTIVAVGAVNATFRSAATAKTGAFPLVANSGIASPYVPPNAGHLFETAANEALNLNLSAAVAVTGHITYIVEA
jgi:hypothetical protein